MKTACVTTVLVLLFLAGVGAAEVAAPGKSTSPPVVDVWPEGAMPGNYTTEPETVKPSNDNVIRLTNVSRPTLTLFRAHASKKNATPAMIVCPGGGYSILAMNKEGTEIAEWLNTSSITALVLKYRVPTNRDGALQDLQRALSLTRAHAAEWNIDPHRLGVIGFSAGGNLSAKASTHFNERTYSLVDKVDKQSCRPDFAVLVYPAYLEDKNGQIASDLNLKAKIPPTLIVHTDDDTKFIVGSKLYDAALTELKIQHEFKLYPTGGHGYGLHCTKDAREWPTDTINWLTKLGIR